MASMTRVDSGNTVTYTITDLAGSTAIATVTITPVAGNTVVFSGSGGLHFDGLAMVANLANLLATNLLPPPSVPAY